MSSLDLIVREARLRGRTEPVDIGILDGRISTLGKISKTAKSELYAQGDLVVPAFVEPHTHLSTAFLTRYSKPNLSGTRKEAIEIARQTDLTQDSRKRVEEAISLFLANGVTRLREHASVFSTDNLQLLRVVLDAKKEWRNLIDIQIVALAGEPMPICEEPLRKAMELGADVVGGIPNVESNHEDSCKYIDMIFDIAKESNAMIDLHTDENDDPSSRALEYMASKTIREGFQGRVTASHACALASYDGSYARFVIDLVRRAGMSIVTNPETNLVLEGRFDDYPKRRGLTRVKELLREGVNVACGHDDILNPFTPFGRGDPLEVGLILALAAQMTSTGEIETIFDMLTINAARVLGAAHDYGIEVGRRADVVVLDATSAHEALRKNADRRYTIREGRVVAEARSTKTVHHPLQQ